MTYIWIEDGNLMEYQGIGEATPGLVTCPLCDGPGELEPEIADEYVAEPGEGSEEEATWE